MLVIQGKVEEWRLQRRAAWKIVEGFRGTSEMPDIYNFYPLPYDDEIRVQEQKNAEQSLEEHTKWYNIASKDLANFSFPAKRSKN